ncbi:MAG: hypothetical protein V4671_10580 [Armatimonadota bacterium]
MNIKITRVFYKSFTHRGYPVEIKEERRGASEMFRVPPPTSPHQQRRTRCFIDGQDATAQMEPSAPGEMPTLEDWEAAARQYIDAVLDLMKTRQV